MKTTLNANSVLDTLRHLHCRPGPSSTGASCFFEFRGDKTPSLPLDAEKHNGLFLAALFSFAATPESEDVLQDFLDEIKAGGSTARLTFVLLDPSARWSLERLANDSDRVVLEDDGTTTSEKPVLAFREFNLHGVATWIKEHDPKRILVMMGAGVSVAAGIPDFRTPGSGLYARLKQYDLPYPEAIFTLDYFREHPEVFVSISREMKLWPGSLAPTLFHHFVKLLHDEGRLLRCYTQNVDGLEVAAGLPADKVVEAHGSFATAKCINAQCNTNVDVSQVKAMMDEGRVPRCPVCGDVVKPNVVFYGEALPSRYFRMVEEDRQAADLLIVAGTSLKVYPFASLADKVGLTVPRVLINNELVGHFTLHSNGDSGPGLYRDVFLQGDVQGTVTALATELELGEALQRRFVEGQKALQGTEPPRNASL